MAYGKDDIMYIRIIGAILIVFACSAVGYYLALSYKREERTIRHLISALDYMECELQYRLTPLPELCRMAAAENPGEVSDLLLTLAKELDSQISPDASSCMTAALAKHEKLPDKTKKLMLKLGGSLGRFDMEGQLRGLETTRQICRKELEALSDHRDQRLRNYQTLAVCAGLALAILLI